VKVLSLILVICFSTPTKANFIDRKAEGWHFYEPTFKVDTLGVDTLKADETKNSQRETDTPKKKKTKNDPLARLNAFKKSIELSKAIAVLDPTYHNVKAYMEIQKVLMERSTRFAEKWMEVVYTAPSLDYTLHHPTSQAARHVYLDEQHREMKAEIGKLSRTYGLFFLYRGDCPYSRQFASIVKSFSAKHHWEVLPISLDGAILPEFPEARMDNGASRALGVSSVPTLLAVEPKSGKVIPLSRGMSTHDQIEDRIRVLIIKRSGL
jgi:conjugal transfer pilus assembly protein TraF